MSKQNRAMAVAVAPSVATPPAVPLPAELTNFAHLPDDSFVREPVVRGLFAVSHATVWRMVASGRLPQPIKITPKIAAWRVRDLRAVLAGLEVAA